MSNFPSRSTHALRRLFVACAMLGLAASAQAATTLETVKQNSSIRIGYANETPFAFTETDGRVTGESPEIAKAIFAKMGIKQVDGVLTEWGSLIPGLRAGRFDVIAAGMYITPARCKQVLFTDPQYQLPDALLTAKGNPKALHSYEDIAKNPEVKLAIMAGTVNLAYARDSGVKDAQILQVPDTTAQLQAVRAGRADAAVGTQRFGRQGWRKSRSSHRVQGRPVAHRIRCSRLPSGRQRPTRCGQRGVEKVAGLRRAPQGGRSFRI